MASPSQTLSSDTPTLAQLSFVLETIDNTTAPSESLREASRYVARLKELVRERCQDEGQSSPTMPNETETVTPTLAQLDTVLQVIDNPIAPAESLSEAIKITSLFGASFTARLRRLLKQTKLQADAAEADARLVTQKTQAALRRIQILRRPAAEDDGTSTGPKTRPQCPLPQRMLRVTAARPQSSDRCRGSGQVFCTWTASTRFTSATALNDSIYPASTLTKRSQACQSCQWTHKRECILLVLRSTSGTNNNAGSPPPSPSRGNARVDSNEEAQAVEGAYANSQAVRRQQGDKSTTFVANDRKPTMTDECGGEANGRGRRDASLPQLLVELALRLGATEAFDLIELTDKTNAGFTVDTTIDFVATNQSKAFPFNLAIAALKGNAEHFPNSNRCVLIGASSENLVFNTFTTVGSGIQIITSEYGQRSDLVAVLDLFAKGIIKAVVHSEPLENVNKVIDELRSFEITGRKVVIPHQEA
ncbi:hypothetical protein R3P38DRAFT_3294951 [Favolaschia claudopus]|uniref:Alcohol dehydrogenase n=1 Tax=Favolaschia claudopus TaxID=2862362 RepID=A0AAV9ZCF7_9AGAR